MSLTVKQENTTRAEVRQLLYLGTHNDLVMKVCSCEDIIKVVGNTSMGKTLHALVCSELDIARDIEGIDAVDILDTQAKTDEILSVDRAEGDDSIPHMLDATEPDYIPDTQAIQDDALITLLVKLTEPVVNPAGYLKVWLSENRDNYPHVCSAIEARLDKASV